MTNEFSIVSIAAADAAAHLRGLGCVTVGIVPDYALDRFGSGRLDPTTIMYRKLAPGSQP